MDDDIKNALRIAKSDEPKYDTGPQLGEATMRSYEPSWKERFQNYLMGTDTAKPSPERRRFAEGMTDIVSSAPGISNVLSGERLAAAMAAEDLPAAGAAAFGMIPGASGYVGKQALNVAKTRLGNRAVEDALRLAERKGYAFGGAPTDIAQPTPAATPNPYQSYVDSLYKNVMGREADTTGQQYWTNQLSSGAQSTQNVLDQFAGSKEFQNLYGANPTQAVSNLYQTALGRAPEQGGLDYWTQQARGGVDTNAYQSAQDKYKSDSQNYNQQMANYNSQKSAYDVAMMMYQLYGNPAVKSMSPPTPPSTPAPVAPQQSQFNKAPLSSSQLLDQFQTAQEYQLRDKVLNDYINYTGEAPRAEQYASAAQAIAGGKTLSDVTGSISQSPKAIAHLVNTGYTDLLGVPPDRNALNYWSNQLSKGTLKPAEFLEGLAKSSEGVEFANEKKVEGLYKELFGRSPDPKESRYNDYLSKMAEGTITEDQMRGELSKDIEAVNYGNTQLVKNMFSDLTGRNPPQPILDDYISKLAEGSMDSNKLYDTISSTPESKEYIKLVEQGMPPKKAGEQAEITQNRSIFAKALDEAGITDPDLRTIMAAQVEAESRFLNVPETSYSGTANGRLKDKFPALKGMTNGALNELKKDDKSFFNKIYGNVNGNKGGDDGYNFRGRGAIQLTGRSNYQKYGELAGLGDALVKNPDLLYDPNVAAKVSIEFMKDMQKHHPGKTNFDKITRGVNSSGEAVAKKVKAYGELKREKAFSVPSEGTTPPATGAPVTPITQPEPKPPSPQTKLEEYNKALKEYNTALTMHNLEQGTQQMIAQSNGWYYSPVSFKQSPPDPAKFGLSFNPETKSWSIADTPPTPTGNIGQQLAGQGAGGNVAGTGQINQPIPIAAVDTGFKPAGGYDVAAANAAGDKLIADFIKAIQSNYAVKSSEAAAAGAGGGGYLGSGGGGYAGMFGTSPSAGWGSVSYMNKGGAVKKALRVAKAAGGRLRMADGGASQGDFISQAYQQHLGRAPDAGGQQFWQQQAQSGMGQQAITDAIRLSQEAQQRAPKAVSQAYADYLGRAPDTEGQQYWTNQLQGGALGIGDLNRAFSAAPEAQQYAGNLSNAYQLAYGQAPKAAEDAMNWARSYRESNPTVLAQDKPFTPPTSYTPDLAAWKPNIPNSNISTPSFNPALDPVRPTPQPSTPSAPSTPTTPSSGDKGTTYDKAVPAWQPNVPASNMETPSISQQLDPVQKPDIPTWNPKIPNSTMDTPSIAPPLEQLRAGEIKIDPKDYGNFVTSLFNQYVNRVPEQAAQDFFASQLAQGSSPADVATAIATSPEAQAGQVGSMFQYMLGRQADPEGLKYFQDQIAQGKMDINDVGESLMSSPEYADYQNQLFEANKSGFTPVGQYDFGATALPNGLGEVTAMPNGYLDSRVWAPNDGTNDVFPTSFASTVLSKGLGPNQQIPAGYVDPNVMLANRNNISDKFQFAVTALQDGLGENGAFKPYVDASINAQKVNDLIGNMDPKDPNNFVTGVYNALTGKNANPNQTASLSQQLTAGTITPAEVAQQIAKQENVPLPPPRPADLAPQSGAFDTLTNTLSGLASKAGQAITGVGQTLGNLASRVSEAFQPKAGKEFAVTLGSRLAKDYGLTLPQISGILAHFGHESGGFKSNVSEGKPLVAGSRGGYGYGQWTGPRRIALEKFAKNKGLDVSKFDTQYQFMQQEPQFKENLEKVKKAGTMEEAARAFQKYESGGDPRWIANWPSRYIYGRQAQNWINSELNPAVAEDQAAVIPAKAEAPLPPERPEDLSGMITTPSGPSPSPVTPISGVSTDLSGALSGGYGGSATPTAGDSAPVAHAPVTHAPVTHTPVTHAPVTHTSGISHSPAHTGTHESSFSVGYANDPYFGHAGVGGSGHIGGNHHTGGHDPYFGHAGSSFYDPHKTGIVASSDWEYDYAKKSGGRVNKDAGGVVDHALRLAAGGRAWTRKEGQNPEGGLNAKGRASAKAEGHNLKPPAPHPKTDKDAARRKSFCSRMEGMKSKLTSSETANDPDSRINKSLRAWNCHADGGAVKKALDTALDATHPKALHHTLAETGYASGGEIWDKPRPKGLGKPKSLSASQKKSAKASAKAAGRPWPNLVDNMRAAQRKK